MATSSVSDLLNRLQVLRTKIERAKKWTGDDIVALRDMIDDVKSRTGISSALLELEKKFEATRNDEAALSAVSDALGEQYALIEALEGVVANPSSQPAVSSLEAAVSRLVERLRVQARTR